MLVPRKGGGRIALREFVVFNDKVKKELLKGGVSYISTNARDVLRKYGRSYSLDAFDKYYRIPKDLPDKFSFKNFSKSNNRTLS